MTVYVDKAKHPYGRMVMCHMMADTTGELMAMADKIGVARKWVQKPGTAYEHFDVCKAAREKAVEYGAQEVTSRDLARLIRARQAKEQAKGQADAHHQPSL